MTTPLKNRLEELRDAIKPLSEEERNVRYDICLSCEHLTQLTAQCKKCGCFMKAKTYIPGTECPIGKWGKIIRNRRDKN
jgi:hypothetical protein